MIAVIINGMGRLNEPSSVVFMVTGVVLLVAASVDALSRKRAAPPAAPRRAPPPRSPVGRRPSQDDVRRHNLGSLLRLLHVRGADLAGRPDRPSAA